MITAREEAERRYPVPAGSPFSEVRSELNTARRAAFEAGAKWQDRQPVEITDDMVERSKRSIYDELSSGRMYEWGDIARAVLTAALGLGEEQDA